MLKPIPFKTGKGELRWVNITGEGKENQSGKMKYTADIVMPEDCPAAVELKAKLDDFWKENKPKGFKGKRKTAGYRLEETPVLDEEGNKQYEEVDGDEVLITEKTGNIIFTFSTDTTFAKSGDKKVVKVYNAKGSPVSLGDKKIGNGSEGYIGGAMGIYGPIEGSAGVTLYLNSVKITKFVEFTGGDDNWEAEDGDGWTGEDNWDAEETNSEEPKSKPRL